MPHLTIVRPNDTLKAKNCSGRSRPGRRAAFYLLAFAIGGFGAAALLRGVPTTLGSAVAFNNNPESRSAGGSGNLLPKSEDLGKVLVIKTSLLDAISQNTPGQSEALAAGIPPGFSWCGGANKATDRVGPPQGFAAVTAYGQVYSKLGSSPRESVKAAIEIGNTQTYVHSRREKKWILVQDQASTRMAGAHLRADFSRQSDIELSIDQKSEGMIGISSPPPDYNAVFWPSDRGAFELNDIDGVYVRMDMRVADSSMSYVANVGADWWRDLLAPSADGFLNNSGAGMSNWIELSTEWKTLHFTSWNAGRTQSEPPPPLRLNAPLEIKRHIVQTSTYCMPSAG